MNTNSLSQKPIISFFSSSPPIDGNYTSTSSIVNDSTTSVNQSVASENVSNSVSSQISNKKPAQKKPILHRFWNSDIRDISHQLASWVWVDYDWKDSTLNESSSCVRNNEVKSWWKTECKMYNSEIERDNYEQSYSRLFPPSLMKTMEESRLEIENCEKKLNLKNAPKAADTSLDVSQVKEISENAPAQVEDSTFVRTKVIKFSPNRRQKRLLYKFFRARRDTYNLCLAEIQKRDMKGFPDGKILRHTCVNADAAIFQNRRYAYLLTVPQAIRFHALTDLLLAYKTEFAKCRKDPEHTFAMSFRSRKSTQSFVIDARAWKRAGIFYPESWTKEPLQCDQRLPNKLDHAAVVKRTPLGEYFICIPYDVKSRTSEKLDFMLKAPRYPRIVSIDPGVRTPFTCYDPCGKTYKMAPKGMKKIDSIHRRMDKLQSKFSSKEIRSRKRYRYKKAWKRIEKRKQNLIKEFHVKTALYLCRNYEVILLPDFETQKKVRRARRGIGKKTVRQLLAWSHYTFRVILEQKAKLFGSKVIICDEHYTSKTCSDCGKIKKDLGCAEEYDCLKCGYFVDRDENAAKNILLRYIRKITPRSRAC